MVQKIILGNLNSNPWIRGARTLVVAGLLAAITAIIQHLGDVDWPGSYDAMIVAGGTAVLMALDKALRGGA